MSASESEPEDAAAAAAGHVDFVRVHLAGEAYAIELGRVSRLVRGPSLTRVPRSPPAVAGVTEVQGDVTAAIDARTLLGADDRDGEDSPAVLVAFARTTEAQSAGVLVDGVEGIETHPVEAIAPAGDAGTDAPGDDPYRAVLDGETQVIDAARLIEAARSG